jgi:hypothetical protein
VLIVSGYNDPRVATFHAAKLTARLQAANGGRAPTILRIDFDSGHGMGSTREQRDALLADNAFTLWCAGYGRWTLKRDLRFPAVNPMASRQVRFVLERFRYSRDPYDWHTHHGRILETGGCRRKLFATKSPQPPRCRQCPSHPGMLPTASGTTA